MDEPRFLTAADLTEKADSLVKRYLEIHIAPGVPHNSNFVKTFQAATCLISPALEKPTFLNVIVGSSPFELKIGHHKLIFEQSDTAAATHLKGVIFLNFGCLSQCTLRMMTAGILEEFVHGMMNIKDEPLVRNVVSFLFPEIGTTLTGYDEREDQ